LGEKRNYQIKTPTSHPLTRYWNNCHHQKLVFLFGDYGSKISLIGVKIQMDLQNEAL
jgi:hypothetical protein